MDQRKLAHWVTFFDMDAVGNVYFFEFSTLERPLHDGKQAIFMCYIIVSPSLPANL